MILFITLILSLCNFCLQALAALGTVMLNCGVGATAGFSAILIPQLKHGKNKLGHNINTEMESWVGMYHFYEDNFTVVEIVDTRSIHSRLGKDFLKIYRNYWFYNVKLLHCFVKSTYLVNIYIVSNLHLLNRTI